MFDASGDYVLEEYAEWPDRREHPDEPFRFDFAPDALHKINVSGGPAYSPHVTDGRVLETPISPIPFVDYLRTCLLGWAGLPGFADLHPVGPHRHVMGGPPPEITALAARLPRF